MECTTGGRRVDKSPCEHFLHSPTARTQPHFAPSELIADDRTLPDIRSAHRQEHWQAVAMDFVSFSIEDPGTGPEIRIKVNGHPLQHLARDVEQIHAKAEGNPGLAGTYAGLSPLQIHGTARHFLGEPQAAWFEDGDTVLMGCTCGEWGCWPLTAVVLASDDVVRWTNFRTGHRDWDLSRLGPFEFKRSQYEAALSSMRLAL